MANLNKVLLIGNLTRDPELRYTSSGSAVTNVGLAVNRRWRSQSGEQQEEVCFVDVTLWSKQAEVFCEYMRKGRPVLIEGRLKQDRWEQDGQKRNRIVVVAENFQFLGSRGDDDDDGGGDSGGDSRPASAPAGSSDSAPKGEAEYDPDTIPF